MKKRLLALACALALALSGCAVIASNNAGEPPEGAVALYFAVSGDRGDGGAVDFEYRIPDQSVGAIEGVINMLLAGPESTGLTSPFPAGVSLLSWQLDKGTLRLNLSEKYGELSGIDLTVADYCFALSLCALPTVESVYISVEGDLVPFRHTQELRGEDVILSGAEEQPTYVTAALSFPHTGDLTLGVEYRQVLITEDDTMAAAVAAAFMEGPSYPSLSTLLPEKTTLLGTEVEDGICYVNLSAEFAKKAPQSAEQAQLLLWSVVNTMGSLESVSAVQILVEGEALASYGGMAIGAPLEPDFTWEK